MYAGAIITLIVGTLAVLLVPAFVLVGKRRTEKWR
jgi:hypothetical protein